MELENLKERWAKALRSGRYRQYLEGALSSIKADGRPMDGKSEQNCCLGVLCRIARVPREQWEDEGALDDFVDGKELMKALGMSKEQMRTAIKLNDDDKASFQEIADWIENDYREVLGR